MKKGVMVVVTVSLHCAEGALKIIDGKTRLVSEKCCDGLGACLGECPQGAITIEERPAEEFDEIEAKHHQRDAEGEKLACGCSSATVQEIERCGYESEHQ
ncbi:MAG: hypothetical protein PHY28_10000, partial [Dehalococcoidales bacterium]|nr:hypothetical protein [Dehalococcoidales bacterium]